MELMPQTDREEIIMGAYINALDRLSDAQKDRDQFAINFSEWIAKKSLDNTLPWAETTAELLEIYKKDL